MTTPKQLDDDAETQKLLISAKLGTRGSGAIRYAAAMYFYNANQISCEMLEVYRRCSKSDSEDPIDLAMFEGVSVPRFLQSLKTTDTH